MKKNGKKFIKQSVETNAIGVLSLENRNVEK